MTRKYTVAGSPDFDKRVDDDLHKIIWHIRQIITGDKLLEVVLLGGYGRGEGTPFKKPPFSQELPYNDYDLVVVSKPLWPWQHKMLQTELRHLGNKLEKDIGIAIDLYLHTLNTLEACEPSLLNIEMKFGHLKIWGDNDLLAKMPAFNLETPPLSEGTRLLMNRGRLLVHVCSVLDGIPNLSAADEALCRKYLYKNALAFGDCILLAHGDYALLYQNKRQTILKYSQDETIPCVNQIIDAYQSACRFKLFGSAQDLPQGDLQKLYKKMKEIYPQFLLWYESRRLNIPIKNAADYCRILSDRPDKTDPLIKTIALNCLLFGWRMFRPTPTWAMIHPRKRLPPAICLLLDGQDIHQRLVSQLLGCGNSESAMKERFQTLAMRLA